jgi:hypothetical protein
MHPSRLQSRRNHFNQNLHFGAASGARRLGHLGQVQNYVKKAGRASGRCRSGSAPHPAHPRADVDARPLARGPGGRIGCRERPNRLFEQAEQTIRNEPRP